MRVGILTTHPIQYQVPWFRALASRPGLDLTVYYCMLPDAHQQGDGFGVGFQWDVPLLDGYNYQVLRNVARNPSVTRFFGCDTPSVWSIVKNGGFDAFIVNGWVVKSCLQLLLACNYYSVPCVVRGESNQLRRRPWWKRLLHRVLLKRYAAFLYIGKSNRAFYQEHGVGTERMFFAPYCVENDRFAREAAEWREKRSEIRRNWKISPDAIVMLFCGKFVEKKRPQDCIEALRLARSLLVADGLPDDSVHLVMVGSGELMESCRDAARRDDRLPVTFAGFLNQGEVSRAYASADCLLLPSDDGETWGLVVNEAMASGLPAIVSDRVGCHTDLVIRGETGWVVPFGDLNRLAEAIVNLARCPTALPTMGANAARLVNGYNYEHVVEGTLQALESVVVPTVSEDAEA